MSTNAIFPERVALGYVNGDRSQPIYASPEFMRALTKTQLMGNQLNAGIGGVDVFASFAGVGSDSATAGAGVGADIAQPRQTDGHVSIVTQSAPDFVEFPFISQPVSIADGLKEDKANKDALGGYVGLTLFKINFKNALGTFVSFFTNANTAARTYTFPDKDLTVAGLVDFASPPAIGSTAPASGKFTTCGINSKPPVGNVGAPAVATDLPTVITLANDIRTRLIDFGIYT